MSPRPRYRPRWWPLGQHVPMPRTAAKPSTTKPKRTEPGPKMRWHGHNTGPCPDCGVSPGTDHLAPECSRVRCSVCRRQWILDVEHNPEAAVWCLTCGKGEGAFVLLSSHPEAKVVRRQGDIEVVSHDRKR